MPSDFYKNIYEKEAISTLEERLLLLKTDFSNHSYTAILEDNCSDNT